MFMKAKQKNVKSRGEALQDATVREFGGGWNIVDNDLNLSTRYATLLDNMSREEDGSMGIRWGTERLVNFGSPPMNIPVEDPQPEGQNLVNVHYFQQSLICTFQDGRIARVLGDGTTTLIWDADIASELNPPANGWSTDVRFVSYAIFSGKLIVVNGQDKPLIIDFIRPTWGHPIWRTATDYVIGDYVTDYDTDPNTPTLNLCITDHTSGATFAGDIANWTEEATVAPPVQYLQDLGTSSNSNVPVCRYVIAMNKYLVMAGDPLFPDRVHISNQNTSGTWFGDIDSDGTYIDLGKVGVQGEQIITGINRYRDQLVVAFFSASVLGKLGIYDDGDPPVHTPDFNDVIEGFGGHSHRCMVNLGNDLFMLDNQGVTSIARSLYSGSTEPKRVSELIDPAINNNVTRLREVDTLDHSFAIYNSNDKQYMCFIPNWPITPGPILLDEDPFVIVPNVPEELNVLIPNHKLLVGDTIEFSDATGFNTITPADLNQEHFVQKVINNDIVTITPDGISTEAAPPTGGGTLTQYWAHQTETFGYVYTFINELKVRAWARYRSWNWTCGARTELGSVVFGTKTHLYLYGSANNPINQDFIDTNFVSDIAFAWEMPWADFDLRTKIKHTRYIQFDSTGTATFRVSMFVDGLYKSEGILIPNISTEFVGGDNGGYGNNGQPYGGGRRTSDQRLYEWPSRGKLFKLRVEGITNEPLNVISISLLYHIGSIRR